MQDIRTDNEQQVLVPRTTQNNNNSSNQQLSVTAASAAAGPTRRQRHLTCYKCNKPDSRAVICCRDGPTRGGYCIACFERYIGEFFRSGFFRHCNMMQFLQDRDRIFLDAAAAEASSTTKKNLAAAEIDSAKPSPATSAQAPVSPEQVTCPSTKVFVAVSGSYNSMALLIQMATLNADMKEKYSFITQNGRKLPPQGKNVVVRPMELVVVHLTRFDHDDDRSLRRQRRRGQGGQEAQKKEDERTDDDKNNSNEGHVDEDDVPGSSTSSSSIFDSPEDAEAFRAEQERIKMITSLSKKLGLLSDNNDDDDDDDGRVRKSNILIKSVASVTSTASSFSTKELVKRCFVSTSSSSATSSAKSLPLSVREDIYRCLVRNGLLNLAKREDAQVVALAQSATSSSWSALNDVTRGRGAGLFEANGYFCDIPVLSPSSPSPSRSSSYRSPFSSISSKLTTTTTTTTTTVVKFIRPLVGTSSRELALFCTILNKDKPFAREIQNCSVENPTSFSPSVPSIDRSLEDFVLNLTKTFASTSFNVAKTIEKVNAINFMRRIEGFEEEFFAADQKKSSSVPSSSTTTISSFDEQEEILQRSKNWNHCPLCLFSKVFFLQEGATKKFENENGDDDDAAAQATVGSSYSLCHGCRDSIIAEMKSLSQNLPATTAKKQSKNLLDLIEGYVRNLSDL